VLVGVPTESAPQGTLGLVELAALFLSVNIGINPVAFELGPLSVHWYGIGYVVAIGVGIWFAVRYAKERGLHEDLLWDIAPWAILAGLAGGRFYYIIQNDPGSYLSDPARIIEVWRGGMAFFGAIIFVSAVVIFFSWYRKQPLPAMLDVAALFAMIGQPIGRLGNIINGDVLGPATDLPWGFVYTHPDSFAPDTTTAFHPAGVYALVVGLIVIAVLYPIRNRFAPGWFAVAYLGTYCVTQFLLFFWRSEPEIALGLQQAQWTAIVLMGLLAVVVAYIWQQGSRPLAAEGAIVPTGEAPRRPRPERRRKAR
jgi:phosphatidylglycerol---prolipoprotein diacylglyceryl transferase